MGIRSWPDFLRSAGVAVQEHNNWKTNAPLGELPAKPKIVWHHDASPAGPSPGALNWIINAYNNRNASAQIWIGYDGVWHFIGSGVAWHTGAVLPGMPDNYSAVGIETDETTGEIWSKALLGSLRIGTAAIMAAEGMDPDVYLHFHKTICSPPGRKSDPEGLSLSSERKTVRALMTGKSPVISKPVITKPGTPTAPGGADPEEDDDMYKVVRCNGIDYAYRPGEVFMIRDPDHYFFLTYCGLINTPHGSAQPVDRNVIDFLEQEANDAAKRLKARLGN